MDDDWPGGVPNRRTGPDGDGVAGWMDRFVGWSAPAVNIGFARRAMRDAVFGCSVLGYSVSVEGVSRRTALMAHRLEKKRNSWDSLTGCSDALQSTID